MYVVLVTLEISQVDKSSEKGVELYPAYENIFDILVTLETSQVKSNEKDFEL